MSARVSDLRAPSGNLAGMHPGPITFTQCLHGRFTAIGPGLADIELTGEHPTPLGTGQALAFELVFASERSFQESGTVTFADLGPALRVATIGEGDLVRSPDRSVLHGTAVLDAWGLGPLSGARGRITSNFVVADDGSVRDEQVVVLFIQQQEGTPS